MREVGIVVNADGKDATVKVDKKDECSKCGMCLFPKNASSIEFLSDNDIGASVGDQVIIERKKEAILTAAILIFLVPLLLIGLSALLTYLFIGIDIWVLILSIIFIIVWYNILSVIDKKLKNRQDYKHIIVEILEKGETNNE